MITVLLAAAAMVCAAPRTSAAAAVAPADSGGALYRIHVVVPGGPGIPTAIYVPSTRIAWVPDPDDPASPPAWVEIALPASTPRAFPARTETLIVVKKGTVLELSNIVGDISVQGWHRNAVQIVARHGRRDRLEATLQDGRLQLGTVSRHGIPAAVDYALMVPEWMALNLTGVDTEISVAGVRSPIQAGSIRGDVRVKGARGTLQLSSVEGQVVVVDADGDVQVSSVNNRVQLDRVNGSIEVQSVNGDIRLGELISRYVEASSMNGTVVYRGGFQPRGRYRLASHTGNLVVGVPEGADIDVSVASFEGAFRSAFPVELGPRRKGRKFNFVLGGGGSSLELESFQGLIELMRPGALPALAPIPRTAPTPPAPPTPKAPPAPSQEDDR